jgi:hypothetical protein
MSVVNISLVEILIMAVVGALLIGGLVWLFVYFIGGGNEERKED